MTSQDNYYNPYQNTESNSNLKSSLVQAAGNLAKFGALYALGGIAAKGLSKGIGSVLSSNAFKGFTKSEIGSIAYNLRGTTGSSPTIGDILKNTPTGKNLTSNFKASTVSFRTAMETRSTYLQGVKSKSYSSYSTQRFTTLLASPKAALGIAGTMVGTHVLSNAAVMYGIDTAFGVTKDYGLKDKAFYDIPGQVGNFAKWVGINAGFSAALKFVKPVAGLFKGGYIAGSKAVAQSNFGQEVLKYASAVAPGIRSNVGTLGSDFYKTTLGAASEYENKFLTKSIKHGIAFGRSVNQFVKETTTRYSDFSNVLMKSVKSPTFFGHATALVEPLKNAFNVTKNTYKTHYSKPLNQTRTQTPGLELITFMETLAVNTNKGFNNGGMNTATSGDLSKLIAPLTKGIDTLNNKGNTLREITGLNQLTAGDVLSDKWFDFIGTSFKQRYATSEVDQVLNIVKNASIGKNIYKPNQGIGSHIQGGGVDLSFFDPKEMVRRSVLGVLNTQIHVPFTNITTSIADITHANEVFSERPDMMFFGNAAHHRLSQSKKNKLGLQGKVGPVTVDDIIGDGLAGHDKLFFFSGKEFVAFNGISVESVTYNRSFVETIKGSSWKKSEAIEIEKLRRAGPIMQELEKRSSRSTIGVTAWLDKHEIGLPDQMYDLVDGLTQLAEGKNIRWKQAVSRIFKTGDSKLTDNPFLIFNKLLDHTTQILAPVFKDNEALDIVFKHTIGTNADDSLRTARIMHNDMALRDELFKSNITFEGKLGSFYSNQDVIEASHQLRSNPSVASRHIKHKEVGLTPDITSSDLIRMGYLDSVVNAGNIANRSPSAYKASIEELVAKGKLTPNQRKALNVHAELTYLRDQLSKEWKMGTGGEGFSSLTELKSQLLKTAKENNFQLERNITDFIGTADLRRFSAHHPDDVVLKNNRVLKVGSDPFVSVSSNPLEFISEYLGRTSNTVTNLIESTTIFKKDPLKYNTLTENMKWIGKNMLKTAAVGFGYRILDTAVASAPFLDETGFKDGIGSFFADSMVRARLGASRVADTLGFTGIAKHLDGLLPGFVTSAPGAIAGGIVSRRLGGGPAEVLKGIAAGAIINRIASPFLPDFTKSHKELEDIYTGREEVPMMKSPFWLLGGTPWQGTKVIGYRPNWYVQMKSRWDESNTLYGSPINKLIHKPIPILGFSIGDLTGSYGMERMHFFSRPYHKTSQAFSEVPVIGPLLAGTIGKILKPERLMHKEFLESQELDESSSYGFSNRATPPSLLEGRGMMQTSKGLRRSAGRAIMDGAFVYNPNDNAGQTLAEKFIGQTQTFMGLQGYLSKVAGNAIFNEPIVMPTLETAGKIASQSRAFYNLNLGGLGVYTEGIRRFIQKPDSRTYDTSKIPNLMPNWLPDRFTYNDPYASILAGELRLPGEAYSRTHPDITRSMPGRASLIGAPVEAIVQYFTGKMSPLLKEEYDILEEGTSTHTAIQDMLAAENKLIQAEAFVYDVKNDISGHVDAIIKDGSGAGGRRALEIKTINSNAFNKMSGPKQQHISQLNFYLNKLGMRKGTIMYVNRENPSETKLYEINYSKTKFQKDMAKLSKARQVTADMMDRGINDEYGYSYSWVDRLKILADVAPISKEFKEAKAIVEEQIRYKQLTQKDITKYHTALKHAKAIARKYELYPKRFSNIFSPDSEANIQSINENIKAASEYSLPERAIGHVWEKFLNSNNWVINKLMAFKDPIEHYEMLQLYNQEFKPWDQPFKSWLGPMVTTMRSKTNTLSGAASWSSTGSVFGGLGGGVIGGMTGAIYGTIHGIYRGVTDSKYIPDEIKRAREINFYFDKLKYTRNMRMAELSYGLTSQEYRKEAQNTLTNINMTGTGQLFSAAPAQEKPYLNAWINTTDESERRRILQDVPEYLKNPLISEWRKNDAGRGLKDFGEMSSQVYAQGGPGYQFTNQQLDPALNIEDMKLKVLNSEGYNSHDFGIGWNEQLYRMQNSENDIPLSNIQSSAPVTTNTDPGRIKYVIQNIIISAGLKGKVNLHINTSNDDFNFAQIIVKKDKSMAITRALGNRLKWGN